MSTFSTVGALYSSRNVFWIKGGWLGLHVPHFMIKYLFVRKSHHFLNRSGLSVCLCVCPYMSAVYCLLSPPVSDENVSVTKYEHFLMWTPMWVPKNWLWQRMSTFPIRAERRRREVRYWEHPKCTLNVLDWILDLRSHPWSYCSYLLFINRQALLNVIIHLCVWHQWPSNPKSKMCDSKMYPPNCNHI